MANIENIKLFGKNIDEAIETSVLDDFDSEGEDDEFENDSNRADSDKEEDQADIDDDKNVSELLR